MSEKYCKSPDLWRPNDRNQGFPVNGYWDLKVTSKKGFVAVEYSSHEAPSAAEDVAVSDYLRRMTENLRIA